MLHKYLYSMLCQAWGLQSFLFQRQIIELCVGVIGVGGLAYLVANGILLTRWVSRQ